MGPEDNKEGKGENDKITLDLGKTEQQLDSIAMSLSRLSMKMAADPSRALQEIHKFVPDSQETIGEYLERYATVLNASGFDTQDLIRLLPLRLTGRALVVFKELPDTHKKNWATLTQKMKDELDSKLNRDLTLAENQEKWQEGDKIADYAERIRKYAKRLYGADITGAAFDKILRDLFLKNLHSSLFENVMRADTGTTFQDVLKVALKEETLQKCKKPALEQKINSLDEKASKIMESVAAMRVDDKKSNFRNSGGRGNSGRSVSFSENNFNSQRRGSFQRYPQNRNFRQYQYQGNRFSNANFSPRGANISQPFGNRGRWQSSSGMRNQYHDRNGWQQRQGQRENSREPPPYFNRDQRSDQRSGYSGSGSYNREQGSGYSGSGLRSWRSNPRLNFIGEMLGDQEEQDGIKAVNAITVNQPKPRVKKFSFCGLLCLFLATTSAMATECAKANPGMIIVLPEEQICKQFVTQTQSVYHTEVEIFSAHDDYLEDAYLCNSYTTRVCTSSILKVFRQDLKVSTELIRRLSPEECREIVDTKKYNNTDLLYDGVSKWMTQNQTVPVFPHFGERCEERNITTLERGSLSRRSDDILTSFGPVESCNVEKGFCHANLGTIVWNSRMKQECRYKNVGTFEAMVSEKAIVIEQLETEINIIEKEPKYEFEQCIYRNVLKVGKNLAVHFPRFRDEASLSTIVRINRSANNRAKRLDYSKDRFFSYSTNQTVFTELQFVGVGDVIDNPAVQKRMRDLGVRWYDPIWYLGHFKNMRIAEAVARSIRIAEVRQHKLKELKELNQEDIVEIMRREVKATDSDALRRQAMIGDKTPQSYYKILRGYEGHLIDDNSHIWDDSLEKEFGFKIPLLKTDGNKQEQTFYLALSRDYSTLQEWGWNVTARDIHQPNYENLRNPEKPISRWMRIKQIHENLRKGNGENPAPTQTIKSNVTARTEIPITPSSSSTTTTSATAEDTITSNPPILPTPQAQGGALLIGRSMQGTSPTHTTTATSTTTTTTTTEKTPTYDDVQDQEMYYTHPTVDPQITFEQRRLEQLRMLQYKHVAITEFREAHERICSVHKQRMKMIKELLDIDPTAAMRMFLQRGDITASKLTRNIVAVTQCVINNTEIQEEDPEFEEIEIEKLKAMLKLPSLEKLKIKREISFNGTLPDSFVAFTNDIGKDIAQLAGRRRKEMGEYMEKVTGFFKDISNSTQTKFQDLKNKTASLADEVKEKVKEPFTAMQEKVKKIGTIIVISLIVIVVVVPIGLVTCYCYVRKLAFRAVANQLLDSASVLSKATVNRRRKRINSVTFASAPPEEEEEIEMKKRRIEPSENQLNEHERFLEQKRILYEMEQRLIANLEHHRSSTNLPFVIIKAVGDSPKLEPKEITVLVDSGSSITMIRRSTLEKLGITDVYKPPPFDATTANGGKVSFIATIQLNIKIGRVVTLHKVYVAEDHLSPAPGLLGNDFIQALNRKGIEVIFKEGSVFVGDEEIRKPSQEVYSLLEPNLFDVIAVNTEELVPRSDNIIMASVKGYVPDHVETQ